MTIVLVCLALGALVCFGGLMAALRSGASDPGFVLEADDTAPVDEDEHRAA